ncbi:MAG: hypothetical protein KDK56_06835 [Simkania sp.]|nr:hypothetical protein [Simkania sp.]
MKIPIQRETWHQHKFLVESYLEEEKLIRNWDTWLLKAFLVFLIVFFAFFIFPGKNSLENLLPIFNLIGGSLTVAFLASNSVTISNEYRRAAIEKEGSWIEENHPESISLDYFRIISEGKSLRFKSEISLRLLPFLCSAGCTIASATVFYMSKSGNLAFIVASLGAASLIAITFLIINSSRKRQEVKKYTPRFL